MKISKSNFFNNPKFKINQGEITDGDELDLKENLTPEWWISSFSETMCSFDKDIELACYIWKS